MMERGKYREKKKEHFRSQSIAAHLLTMVVLLLWFEHVWLPVELAHRHLLMMSLLQATGWMQRNIGAFCVSQSVKCIKTHWSTFHHSAGQPSSTYSTSQNFLIEATFSGMERCVPTFDWYCTAKATKELFRVSRGGLVDHLILIRLSCIPSAEDPIKKQELKVSAVKAWESITREDTKHLLMFMALRHQPVIDCKWFSTKY